MARWGLLHGPRRRPKLTVRLLGQPDPETRAALDAFLAEDRSARLVEAWR